LAASPLTGASRGVSFWEAPAAYSLARVARAASGEEEVDIDSMEVRWLPAMDFYQKEPFEPKENTLVLPCFPLGSIAYVPGSEEILNIFEPRYRAMYSDILLSGGRRFVVPQVRQDQVEGSVQLAEVGVVLYLDDLKEVSEQTMDQIKYVCSHKVIGRVRIKRVLNPAVFADRSSYLRVEVEDIVDEDLDTDYSAAEKKLIDTIEEVDRLQEEAEPDLKKFRLQMLAGDGGQNATRDGLWSLLSDWSNYVDFRLQIFQQRFQRELQQTVVSYFEKQGNVPRQVSLNDLPPELQKEVLALQEELQEEAAPLQQIKPKTISLITQSANHGERLAILRSVIEEDGKRLKARLALKSVFGE